MKIVPDNKCGSYRTGVLIDITVDQIVEALGFKANCVDDPDKVVEYGQTGRVRLTTLTKEFFMPGFLERDEGEREEPCEKYPWDGVSGVRPFHEIAATTTVGVY